MKTKNSKVDIINLSVKMFYGLKMAECAIKDIQGLEYEVVVTSGKDGIHSKYSLHYMGDAVDIRIKDMKQSITRTVELLKEELNCKGYDVVLEKDHIHIEYDPK